MGSQPTERGIQPARLTDAVGRVAVQLLALAPQVAERAWGHAVSWRLPARGRALTRDAAAQCMLQGLGNVTVGGATMAGGIKDERQTSGLSLPKDGSWEATRRNARGVVVGSRQAPSSEARAKVERRAWTTRGRRHAAREDFNHQAIEMTEGRALAPQGGNGIAGALCVNVGPATGCISMEELAMGALLARPGETVTPHANRTTHPNDPVVTGGTD